MDRVTKASSESIWRERLRRFETSGKSVKDFCLAEGCSDKSFYTWRKRLKKGRDEVDSIEVHHGDVAPMELVLGRGDIVVRLGTTFDEAALRRPIHVLRGACT